MPISRQTNSFGFFEQECITAKKRHHGGGHHANADSSNSLFSISMRSMVHNGGSGRRSGHEGAGLGNATALPELFGGAGSPPPPAHPHPPAVQRGGGGGGGGGGAGAGNGSFYSYTYSSNGFFPANKHATMKMVTEKRMSHLQMKTKRKLCTTGTSGAFNASRLLYVPATPRRPATRPPERAR